MASRGILARIVDLLLPPSSRTTGRAERPRTGPSAPPRSSAEGREPGRLAGTETVRIDPGTVRAVRIDYAPDRDGDPDAGEVIWTWVPYDENDGRGKDRPVLVIGRQSADRVYAVRMTSKHREGARDLLPLGTGPWDAQGRPSWVDVDALYSVHARGMRREAAVLDRERYAGIARALGSRYGWTTAG